MKLVLTTNYWTKTNVRWFVCFFCFVCKLLWTETGEK